MDNCGKGSRSDRQKVVGLTVRGSRSDRQKVVGLTVTEQKPIKTASVAQIIYGHNTLKRQVSSRSDRQLAPRVVGLTVTSGRSDRHRGRFNRHLIHG